MRNEVRMCCGSGLVWSIQKRRHVADLPKNFENFSWKPTPHFDFVSRKFKTMAKTAPLKKKGGRFEFILHY